LYRLYLLDLNTNIESNVYENNSLSGNPIHLDLVLDYDTSYSSRLEVYTSNEYYSESNYSNIVTTESEPTTTTQTPTTQTPTTTTTTQTPTTTTTTQTSTTPTTGNPTDSPNNRDQSKSDDKFLSEEIIEMLIYVAGTLGGLLLVILMCIRYIKKKKVGNVDNNRPINNTTVYSNPLYDDGRNSGDTNNTINRSNRDITGYIEVEETPIYSSDHTEDETDLDNRIITDIYSEVNRAGLVPKNMINDEGTNL